MFTGIQPAGSWLRRYRAVGASVAAHVALLAVIVFHHPKPIDISPTWLAWGNSEHSYKITYLAPSDEPADEVVISCGTSLTVIARLPSCWSNVSRTWPS